jgi:TIR domain
MTAKVFISYRREDSAGSAGRVHDRLERDLGRDLLFMDVDAIPLGVNFGKALRDEVAKCDTLLAVIGPNWLDARDEHGNRRLEDPNDFLRIEIATALQRNIPVIPILLDGAKVPRADRLPMDLQELEQRNGLDVRHVSFHSDMDKLCQWLKERSGQFDSPPALPTQSEESWSVDKVEVRQGPEESRLREAEALRGDENTHRQEQAEIEHTRTAGFGERRPAAHRSKTGISAFLSFNLWQSRRPTQLDLNTNEGKKQTDCELTGATSARRDWNRLEILLVSIGLFSAIGLFITGAYIYLHQ